MNPLPRSFYTRRTDNVARDLLGKLLVRRLDDELLGGVIVETEAYFGGDDPASRAFEGLKTYNRFMFEAPGYVFIYNVHKYWMLNLIAHTDGVGGILIRAIEPTMKTETMKRNRPVKRLRVSLRKWAVFSAPEGSRTRPLGQATAMVRPPRAMTIICA